MAGVVYGRGAAPGVLTGDSGELQFAAWLAGLSHPTGYPLYLILGWAWSHGLAGLGLASPAQSMTLLSVLFGALAVALTYLLAMALLAQSRPGGRSVGPVERIAALVAALTFAFTPTFWSQAVVTEVYTLHAALVAALLWLALLWRAEVRLFPKSRTSQSGWLLAALAFLFGLGLAHHRTTLLLLPVLLVFLTWQAPAGYWRSRWRTALGLVLLALAPLLLYLYVPLRADATPYLSIDLWPGQPTGLLDRSPAGLFSYLLGQGFAGEIQGLAQAAAAAPNLVQRFSAELTPVGLLLAVVGVVTLALRRQWALLWLMGASFLLLTGFNLLYTIGDIAVFYIPSYLIASVWIGVAVAWLAEITGAVFNRRWVGLGEGAGIVTAVLLVALPVYLFLSQAPAQDRSQDSAAADGWQALLKANPAPNAVLLSNDRDELMPLWYLQQVEGVRPDLAGVFPLLLAEPGWLDVGQAVDSALSTGRPVYLIKPMPGLEIKAALGQPDPSGLTPVLGPAITAPPTFVEEVVIDDAVRLLGFDVQHDGQSVQIDLHWQPLRPLDADYTSFVQLLAAGDVKVAQSDQPVGGVYYPTSLWQPGQTLRDRHTLLLPADAAPGPYRLHVGMYQLIDGEIVPLDAATLATPVEP
jgi:4-amino-4-deoxy-L-arabinose transferase-like glycosyltransferase